MPRSEYYQSIVAAAKDHLPEWLYQELHRMAMPQAGGKSRWAMPKWLEKLALTNIKPSTLKDAPEDEIKEAWLRVNQWYSSAKQRGQAVEDYVNAAIFLIQEMEKRGIKYNPELGVARAAVELSGKGLIGKLDSLPKEVMVVRDFVSLVGSVAQGKESPSDCDVLFRAKRTDDDFLVQAENAWLPVRNVLDPEKTGIPLHFIDNPQGAHGDFLPLYDLVLRRKNKFSTELVKEDINLERASARLLEAIQLHNGHIDGTVETSEESQQELMALLSDARDSLEQHIKTMERMNDKKNFETNDANDANDAEIPHIYENDSNKFEALAGGSSEGNQDSVKLDLGCGDSKAEGFIGIDVKAMPLVDVVHDLNTGIPYADNSIDYIRANHSLEHLVDKEAIMAEVHRVLKPGGILEFEVPSTSGEGAFNHPGHKTFWNKSTFQFWTQPYLREDRPAFEELELEEFEVPSTDNTIRFNIKGKLRKPLAMEKVLLQPFGEFTPPKPTMGGVTELFKLDDLWKWAANRIPIAVEPKWNGFRGILEKKGKRAKLWFEGNRGTDQLAKYVPIKQYVVDIPQDFIADVDVAIARDGKRLPRPELMRLNAKDPRIDPGESLAITVFDLPYINGDLHEKPFSERREKLEKFFKDYLDKDPTFHLSPMRKINDKSELESASKWAFDFDKSEGLVAKEMLSGYELNGSAPAWAKLKKSVELKVKVLAKHTNESGGWNYESGLAISNGEAYKNIKNGYVNLGKTFNTGLEAEVGDVLTVAIQELILDPEAQTLVWLGPSVQDVDKTRSVPYATRQAIDIANRGGVFQGKPAIEKELELSLRAFGVNIVKKVSPEDEGDELTRGQRAEAEWKKNWGNILPISGEGRFVYQHHWRGLDEESKDKSDEWLMDNTDHSIHGDLRLEGNDSLWGIAAFLGSVGDNKTLPHNDKLLDIKPEDSIRGRFKLPQPKDWLDVGVRSPLLVEPGGVGATSEKYSKFFAMDYGTYRMGYAKESVFEVFLNGKILNGRYIIQRAQRGGEPLWLIKKPEDQTPFSDRLNLDDELSDQKSKRRKWIYWPKSKPHLISLANKDVVKVVKIEHERRIVYGVVLRPDVFDAHQDIMTPKAVEEAAHYYLENARVLGLRHGKQIAGAILESYISPVDFKMGNGLVKKGDWIMAARIDDQDVWEKIISGEYRAFSIGGFGTRQAL